MDNKEEMFVIDGYDYSDIVRVALAGMEKRQPPQKPKYTLKGRFQ